MNSGLIFTLAFAIGIVAGLRSLTAPAAVSIAAWLKWFNLENSPLHFMASGITALIFGILALGELVADKLPNTPNRTAPVGLIARIVTGALCGATLSAGGGQSLVIGAVLGVVGALVGTFGGFQVRAKLMKVMPANAAAVLEDIVAIVGGLFVASRV
jgi:uncharacterized membrane protein